MNWKKGILIGSATLLVLIGGVFIGTKIGNSSTKENSKVDSKVEETRDTNVKEVAKSEKKKETTKTEKKTVKFNDYFKLINNTYNQDSVDFDNFQHKNDEQYLMLKKEDGSYNVKGEIPFNARYYKAATEDYISVDSEDGKHQVKYSMRFEDRFSKEELEKEGYVNYFEFDIINSSFSVEDILLVVTKKDDGEILVTINEEEGYTLENRIKKADYVLETKDYKNAVENKDVKLAYNPLETVENPYMVYNIDDRDNMPFKYVLANRKYESDETVFSIVNELANVDEIIPTVATIIAIDNLFLN
ncbi:hypothetical protein [Vagococcus fluvialis]|uniref:hypothetical protein n=1 Tax=Vagococcus fluvialis TaxID=2738 RepID=UPI001D0A2BDA|nr:hypothetical protein [Vagococcus fluvialis]UDM84073.1 hypothetical protein K5K96_15280 [Vagococcus fluvialis]